MFQGIITGLREGLEVFLIIAIMHRYLFSSGQGGLRKYIHFGLLTGILISCLLAIIIKTEIQSKLWEAGAGFVAMLLVSTFIIYAIKHKDDMSSTIKADLKKDISKWGVFILTIFITAREGAELVLFTVASPEKDFATGSITGVLVAAILALGIFYSMIKVPIRIILTASLAYLILQAGFILGYSVHEFLSYLKEITYLPDNHFLLTKFFDASKILSGLFDHKTGAIGLPLYVVLGWYSRPEIIQFVIQYGYTGAFLIYWWRKNKYYAKS